MHRATRSQLEPSPIRNPILDSLAFAGLVAVAVAGLLTAVHARLLAPELTGTALGSLIALAMAGTGVIYGVDRLRDVERDRASWPERAAFIERHDLAIRGAVAVAAGVAMVCAAQQPPGVWIVCAVISAVGLAHRRLKSRTDLKLAYLTAAWWGVTVGLPWVRGGGEAPWPVLLSAGGGTALAFAANMVASNPGGAANAKRDSRRPRALFLAAAGVACALAGPGESIAVAWIPAAQFVAVLRLRDSERSRLWLVDGSLAAGAAACLVALG